MLDWISVDVAWIRAVSFHGRDKCCLGGVEDQVGYCAWWADGWSCLVQCERSETTEGYEAISVVG